MRNRALRERLQFLKGEEEKHRALLERLYKKSFPEVTLELPAESFVPVNIAMVAEMAVPKLFKLAMEAEQTSERFYQEMAARAKEPSGKALLIYLSRTERGHYHLLQNEYDLLSQFPDYYKAEEFQLGEEFIHLGP